MYQFYLMFKLLLINTEFLKYTLVGDMQKYPDRFCYHNCNETTWTIQAIHL